MCVVPSADVFACLLLRRKILFGTFLAQNLKISVLIAVHEQIYCQTITRSSIFINQPDFLRRQNATRKPLSREYIQSLRYLFDHLQHFPSSVRIQPFHIDLGIQIGRTILVVDDVFDLFLPLQRLHIDCFHLNDGRVADLLVGVDQGLELMVLMFGEYDVSFLDCFRQVAIDLMLSVEFAVVEQLDGLTVAFALGLYYV